MPTVFFFCADLCVFFHPKRQPHLCLNIVSKTAVIISSFLFTLLFQEVITVNLNLFRDFCRCIIVLLTPLCREQRDHLFFPNILQRWVRDTFGSVLPTGAGCESGQMCFVTVAQASDLFIVVGVGCWSGDLHFCARLSSASPFNTAKDQ